MTDLEMLKHLLKKSCRIYDELVAKNGTVMIQVHIADTRHEWSFDKDGNFLEEWENPHETQWISNGWGRYY